MLARDDDFVVTRGRNIAEREREDVCCATVRGQSNATIRMFQHCAELTERGAAGATEHERAGAVIFATETKNAELGVMARTRNLRGRSNAGELEGDHAASRDESTNGPM